MAELQEEVTHLWVTTIIAEVTHVTVVCVVSVSTQEAAVAPERATTSIKEAED
jgi:hypothetical protein